MDGVSVSWTHFNDHPPTPMGSSARMVVVDRAQWQENESEVRLVVGIYACPFLEMESHQS